MSDRWAEMFARQADFNRRVFEDKGVSLKDMSIRERTGLTKDFVLHAVGELLEVLNELDWKMHRRREAPVVRGNVLEEYVDVLKFTLGMGNVWGFTPEEVFEEFQRKSNVVEAKYAMERTLHALPSSARVVAVDIDGVLNTWPACFVDWWVSLGNAPPENNSLAALRAKVGPERLQELKDRYRTSGSKRIQPVKFYAKEFLDGLRAAGLTVVLLTRRPYWRISRIYADTLEWLEANGLRRDAVLFHPEKHRKILEEFPNLVALVEDDPGIARSILEVGKAVVLVDGELNAGQEVPGATRAHDLTQALTAVLGLL